MTNAYEAIAQEYIAYRSISTIGAEAVILDIGCGNGIPITKALVLERYYGRGKVTVARSRKI